MVPFQLMGDNGTGSDTSGKVMVLFLSFGFSLQQWADEGFFDREVALYNDHADEYERIYLLTYGDETDLRFVDDLASNVEILPKRIVSNDVLYSLLAPFIHFRELRDADVVKSEQMLGSWSAVIAKIFFRVPMLARTGYVLSIFYDRQPKPAIIRYIARLVELITYKVADGVITSSPRGYRYVEETYCPRGVHRMIPNYIETDVFEPMAVEPAPGSLCFVGRLAPQKNLFTLLEALDGLPYSLTIVGSGPQRDELESFASNLNVDVTFAGTVPNHELPETLNRHEAFVLPSHYEGMPKALLEAMSCGLPVVGTDVVGINEVIDHEVTGLLCETDDESICEVVERILEDDELGRRLGEKAREEIIDNYSLAELARRERALVETLDE